MRKEEEGKKGKGKGEERKATHIAKLTEGGEIEEEK